MNPASPKNSTSTTPTTAKCGTELDRRQFVKYSFGIAAGLSGATFSMGCAGGTTVLSAYPIDSSQVKKTTEQMLAFDVAAEPIDRLKSNIGLHPTEMSQVQDFDKYGYGRYRLANGLPVVPRHDLLAASNNRTAPTRRKRLANFFAMTDVHMTDKEAPNQLLYIQQADSVRGGDMTSIYSPTILYTTQMLGAAH